MYGIGGVVSLGIALLISIAILFSEEEKDYTNIIPLILIFAIPGIILCLMTWMNQITLNSEEIIQRNMWGKTKSIKIHEIKSITFNPISLYLKINDGIVIIKCHDHLKGIEEIINTMTERTGITRNQMKYIK